MNDKKTMYKNVLSNGLTILIYPDNSVPKVSAQLWYNVGSKNEKSGERGLAHLLEHMIFKGTKELSESDINLITHKLSGYTNAFTSYDYTGYLFDFPTSNWRIALRLFADCMRNCEFKQEFLTSELKAVIQELKMYRDDYQTTLIEHMISNIFPDHPYHHPIIGYKQDLWSITRQGLLAFYKKHYVPNNATLVVVGDVEVDEVQKLAEEQFGAIPADKTYKKDMHYHARMIGNSGIRIFRDVAQPIMNVCFVVGPSSRPQGYNLDLLGWLLANGKGSRLYRRLVHEYGLATDVQAWVDDLFEYNLFFISVQPKDVASIPGILEHIKQEIMRASEQGFSDKELARAKKLVSTHYLDLFENFQELAYAIGQNYLATGDERYVFDYLKEGECADESLKNLLATYFRPILMHTGYVLPLDEGEVPYWHLIQEESDKADECILSRKVRESAIEEGVLVKKVSAQEPAVVTPPDFNTYMLPNGLKVLTSSNDRIDKIDIVFELKADYLYDPPGMQGLCNFVYALLEEGTTKHPGEKFSEVLESHGIDLTLKPGLITMSMLSADFKKGLELLYQLLTQAEFAKDAIERIRTQLFAQLNDFWDSPWKFSTQLARERLYHGHPYAYNLLGTRDAIESITRDDLFDFYYKFVTPTESRIAVVGNVDSKEMFQAIEEVFGAWRPNQVPDLVCKPLGFYKKEEIHHPINRDQSVLCFAGLSVERMHPDYDKLLIFDQIFSGGQGGSLSSRLFTLREQSGLFYTIGGSLVAFADKEPGMFLVKTIVSQDRLKEAQTAIKKIINEGANSVSEQEIIQARHAILNHVADLFSSNYDIAKTLLFLDEFNLPVSYISQRRESLNIITAGQIKSAVRSVLDENKLLTLRVGR